MPGITQISPLRGVVRQSANLYLLKGIKQELSARFDHHQLGSGTAYVIGAQYKKI